MAKNKITITPQPGPQWDFLATEADICIFGGSAGGGKAQPLSEPVLTPFGFRPMGSVKAGDKVISATGRQTTVVQTFPQGKKGVFRVLFEDGAQTRCTKDHLWFANGTVMTTSAIIDGLAQGKDYQIPLCGAVQFENRGPAGSLIPYALGTYLAGECVEVKAKHIPVRYKYAPPQDRVSLIQGLMDKGGRISKEGRCGFYTDSEKLAKDMQWLVWSIGGMAYIKREDAGGFLVGILTKDDSELFPRMKAVLKGTTRGNLDRRILSIEPCGEEECQCIRVDEPDGLYVTKDFVVTHNTHGLLLTPLMYKGVQGFNCTIFRRTFKQVFSPGGLWDTAQSIYGLIPNAQMKKVNTSWEFSDNDGTPISKVTFAHIENYSGVDDWQGSQLCEICCETDTPVLMGDGTYKAVADIKVGDRVQTLNGVCEVTAVGRERLEECVAVECDGGRQIQTADHKLLTDKGWLSYNDIIREETDTFCCSLQSILSHYHCKCAESSQSTCRDVFSSLEDLCSGPVQICGQAQQSQADTDILSLCEHIVCVIRQFLNGESIQCYCGGECGGCFQQNTQGFQTLLCIQHLGLVQEHEASPEVQGCQDSLETCAYTVQRGQESDCVSSELRRRELLRRALIHLRQELDGRVHPSLKGTANHGSMPDESSYAQNEKQSEDYQYCYCACLNLCDECIRFLQDIYQWNARRLNGVVLHNPIGSRPCDTDRIQEDSRHALQYSHPYIESLRFEAEECVSYSSCEISPCGIKKVKPFTVYGMNHYITKYGFVNKNCFDELTHFDEATFFYMMSRNRSTCGVKPFIRATCNPDADSWVAKFIEWWIDQDTGYPIPERSGKIRWFVRRDGIINWADTKEELWERFDLKTEEEKDEPRSVTFIMSSIYDNKELLKVNPQYLASLKSLPEVERERLLMGNWKIKPAAGMYFKRTQVQVLLDLPSDLELYCRAWDIAATADKESGDPDYTAGALLGLRKDKSVVVMDVINKRLPAAEVEKLIYNTAVSDRKKYGLKCKIRIPQDPGAAGKILAQNFIKMLSGFPVKAYPVSGSKEQRATPFAAQWQVGNVYVLAADWNKMFFNQLESFPQGTHDDMVDAASDAFNELAKPTFSLRNML